MPNQKRAEKIKEKFLTAYESYSDDIFAFALSRVSDREVALDLTQEVFTSVWTYLSRGKRVNNLRSFLFRSIRNKVTDYYRKKKSLSLDKYIEAGWDVSDHGLALAYSRQQIDSDFSIRAISALSPKHYQVIHMRFVKDMSLDDIAFVLGINKNAVSVRLHRALQYAREHIGNKQQGHES